MEEILPNGFRSKASLFRQVLRELELQMVERAYLWLNKRNYVRFLQMFQQGPQRRCISSLFAVSLCSMANEFLDAFFGEAFQFYLALPHPLVEYSNEVDFVGDTLIGISSLSKRVGEVGNI